MSDNPSDLSSRIGGRTVTVPQPGTSLDSRIDALEVNTNVFAPLSNPSTVQTQVRQFQATSFVSAADEGQTRINLTTAGSVIDEETLASVKAYATFDDYGGDGSAATEVSSGLTTISVSFTDASFTSTSFASELVPTYKIPMFDNEGKTAYYRGHINYLNWSAMLHPEPSQGHQKQFLTGHSVELNVPGTVSQDQGAFCYYDSHADFNVSSSFSVSLWLYPTDISTIASETWRTLLYRRIDASNHYAILLKPADSKVYVFVNEAGATTKLVSSSTVNLNAWNNIIFTYNPATNALVIYLNDDSTSSTPADSYTAAYTTDAHMYIGGLPDLPEKRFTGYMDNFVFWTGKILTATEVDNMWLHGTII